MDAVPGDVSARRPVRITIALLVGVYFVGMALLGGMAISAVKFDQQRSTILAPLDGLSTRARARLVEAESWEIHVRAADSALARGDVSHAEMAWHRAYTAALRSRRWEAMVDVGDAALRIGAAANGRKASERTARRMYLDALFRARSQRSVEGAVRSAEAFAALADREAVDRCLYIAEQLAAGASDPGARERVAAFKSRWRAQSLSAANALERP